MNRGISIILPILNEAEQLPQLLTQLEQFSPYPHEVVFVDGGSTDGSVTFLKRKKKKVLQTQKGRAVQMNFGAANAHYDWLYFLHADSILPKNAAELLWMAMENPNQAACFQMAFETNHWLLRVSGNATRFNHLLCRGGDQSLFIHRAFFKQLGGFHPEYKVCEDIHLIRKIYQKGTFKILDGVLTTSARRFTENGVFQLLFHFGVLQQLHFWGASPQLLYRYYSNYVK